MGARWLLGGALAFAAACGGQTDGDEATKPAAEQDSMAPGDAGTGDAGPIDVGTVDAGASDGGAGDTDPLADAGPKGDAGPCPVNGQLCDDGDPCTAGDRCVSGACVGGDTVCDCESDSDCAGFEDGDLCNGTLVCNKSGIKPRCTLDPKSVVVCDSASDTVCAPNTCNPKTGGCVATPAPAGTLCEDGDPCTPASSCKDGKCVALSANSCQCTTTADCAALNDANKCDGTWYCALSEFPWRCKLNTSSAVTCSDANDTACVANACDAKTGECAMTPVADGTPCDDGDKLTAADACKAGKCAPGLQSVCTKQADCDAFEDGDLCNGTLFCDLGDGTCKVNSATVIVCPSAGDTDCTKNTCDAETGACNLKAVKNGTGCDDDDKCSVGEICLGGACGQGKNVCICTTDAQCQSQDDGDLCNGILFCDKAKGACTHDPSSVITCPTVDDTACQKRTCAPKTGACDLSAQPTGTTCDDGDKCTVGDVCDPTGCVPGTFICTCKSDDDCKSQDDGDLCNGVLFCDKSAKLPTCKPNPASVVSCPTVDDTDCRRNECQPKTGKCGFSPVADASACSDGDKCATGDLCFQAQCKPGTYTCACKVDGDCLAQDDGDLCNGVPYCDVSGEVPQCKPNPASVVWCPKTDDTQCLTSACDPKTGKCQVGPKPVDTPCSDGSVCTSKDRCKADKCVGAALDCNDNDVCTTDGCDPVKGCTHASSNCDDGNECTVDSCDAGKCSYSSKDTDKKICNADGNGCTVNDICGAGVCKAGPEIVCSVAGGPCQKPACVSLGGHNFQCSLVPRNEGAVCTDEKACRATGACNKGLCEGGSTIDCEDGEFCSINTCKVGQGCVAVDLADATTCTSGKACTSGETCSKGKCGGGGAKLWEQLYGGTIDTAFDDVAAFADGSSTVAGWVRDATSGSRDGLLLRLDLHGKQQWSRTFGGSEDQQLTGVVALADGGVATVGRLSLSSAALKGTWVRVDAASKTLWTSDLGARKPRDLAATGSGGFFVGGDDEGGYQPAWIARLDGVGKVAWTTAFPSAPLSRIASLAGTADGGVVAVGEANNLPLVVAADALGNKLWVNRARGWADAFGYLHQVVQAPDGDVMVAGWRAPGSGLTSATVLLRLDAVSGAVRRKTYIAHGVGEPDAVAIAVDSGGQTTVISRHYKADKAPAEMFSVTVASDDDTVVAQRVQAPQPDTEVQGGVAMPGGGFLVVGRAKTGSAATYQGWAARTDPWAAFGCADSGKCADVGAGCDDGDPCTLERCIGPSGCLAIKASMPCDDGDACSTAGLCLDGACKAVGKRFDVTFA